MINSGFIKEKSRDVKWLVRQLADKARGEEGITCRFDIITIVFFNTNKKHLKSIPSAFSVG